MYIVAHRGVSAFAPENTLAAFRMAAELGVGVEFDVQLARDGVPVVIHDETLMRYTRRKDRVTDLTSRQLADTDVGSWFSRKHRRHARPEFAHETVPALIQVLDLLSRTSGPIYVELKCGEQNYRQLARTVCDIVEHHPLLPKIIIKSFKLGAVSEVRHLLPSVQTAALFAPEITNFLRRREYIIALAREFDSQQISVHHSLVTPRLSDLAAKAGMPMAVWTVDDPAWLARRAGLEIYALITNDPTGFITRR